MLKKRAISHIEHELNIKNDEKMAKIKQIAFDHESVQLAQSAIAQLQMQIYLADTVVCPLHWQSLILHWQSLICPTTGHPAAKLNRSNYR